MIDELMKQNTAEIKTEINKIKEKINKLQELRESKVKKKNNNNEILQLTTEINNWQKLLNDLQFNLIGKIQ